MVKVVHAFDLYDIPKGGIGGRCHVLREKERAALMDYCVASLPGCYITKALLRKRMAATGKSASDLLANKLLDPGSVMSGDFGEIVTLFFLGSERDERSKCLESGATNRTARSPPLIPT